MITAEVHGVGNVARLLNKTLPDEVQKQLAASVAVEAQKIYGIAEADAPVATGELKSELQIKTSQKGLVARIGIFRSAARGFVARFLEFGTRRHLENAVNRKALAFGGRFAASAENPGVSARRWLIGASNDERTAFIALLRQAIIAALRKVNGS